MQNFDVFNATAAADSSAANSSTVNSSAANSSAAAALIPQLDFLALSRANPQHLKPFEFTLQNGVRVEVWDTGVICLTPITQAASPFPPQATSPLPAELANPASADAAMPLDIVISCGVHGNETAPIELCNSILKDILAMQLPLAHRLLMLFANPPAMNAGVRELVDNMNRLFSGHHSKGEFNPSWERDRAAALEGYVSRFYQGRSSQVAVARVLYDLHTAIRGSAFEKFAVYPFLHGKPWSQTQLQFLRRCEVNTLLLMQTPASTFSYYGAQAHGAHAFTLELGKVRPFGDNDMRRFAACDESLRLLIAGADLAMPTYDDADFNLFAVYRAINKQTDAFELAFARDVENFTQFPLGTLLARDGDTEYRVEQPGEALIFPNANVAIGQRAMLMVVPTSIAGQTAP
jgi:succinylglutamate desuccinylase